MNGIVDIAMEAARRGGETIVPRLGKATIALKDSTYNLVTDADRASEDCIHEFLHMEMPGSSLLSEESFHNAALSADSLWIVDPLDGTTNFAHQIPHFAVSVAYAEKGKLLAGAVYDPLYKEMFSATAGKGAFLNGVPIKVSTRSSLRDSVICTGFYYDRDATMEKTLAALHSLLKAPVQGIRRTGCASLDTSWIGAGRFDGYFEYSLAAWDFAAGLLILREAGGMASDPQGAEASLWSKGLICSNGLIHDQLLHLVLQPGTLRVE